MEYTENYIEWVTDSGGSEIRKETLLCTITERKVKTKIRKMAEKHPRSVRIISENEDGTMLAELPRKALHLSIQERRMTDEQKAAASERMRAMHKKKGKK